MTLLDDVQEIADLVDKSRQVELYKKILALDVKILELNREKLKAEDRNAELERLLAFKGKLHFKAPLYYLEGDNTPYCPSCWEGEGRAIHMTVDLSSSTGRCNCQRCRAWFDTKREPPSHYSGQFGYDDDEY
jgi:hypothetical protein